MSLDRAALDRYITREPYWMEEEERPARHCTKCGRFLKDEPEGGRSWVQISRCNGEAKVLTCHYGENSSDEGILQILGEEYRGKEYKLAYPPECGTKEGSIHADFDGDIRPEDAPSYKHDPHFFVEDPWCYQETEIRTCVCGHINEEAVT